MNSQAFFAIGILIVGWLLVEWLGYIIFSRMFRALGFITLASITFVRYPKNRSAEGAEKDSVTLVDLVGILVFILLVVFGLGFLSEIGT